MKYALVTVSGGIIDDVTFYDDQLTVIQKLSEFVKAMNPESCDAAVCSPDGMILNAKAFLDENEQYVERQFDEHAISDESDESIFIIGNPGHHLGFMAVSPDDPLAYKKPEAALSDLGQMRNNYGFHLKLYQVLPVNSPVMQTSELEAYNEECEVEDFDYSLVSEYLN